MEAYVNPLEKLGNALRWFIAVPELQVLHLSVSPELRDSALRKIAEAQDQKQNRSAIFFMLAPAANDASEWQERITELNEGFSAYAEAAAQGTPPLVLPAPRQTGGIGARALLQALQATVDAVAPSAQGVVAVLAPQELTNPTRWVAELTQLLTNRARSSVRFIVVEAAPAPSRAVIAQMGGFAECVDVHVAPNTSKLLLTRLLAGMKTAPPGAEPLRVAGAAGPREAPPPRKGRSAPPPEVAAEELRKLGVNPAFGDPEVMKALRIETLSASLAQEDGRPQEAIAHQIRARDVAEQAGLKREATLFHLMLGGYVLQGGREAAPQALRIFDESAARAKAEGFTDLGAQSHMARGSVFLLMQRPLDAARAYGEGGAVGETQPSKVLAIECYRMMGKTFLDLGHQGQAVAAWQRAISVVDSAPPTERSSSSGLMVASNLAAIYRGSGLHREADELDAKVASWSAAAPKAPSDGPDASAPGAV
jgi:tetratricopeptide (TPR) repeat protein